MNKHTPAPLATETTASARDQAWQPKRVLMACSVDISIPTASTIHFIGLARAWSDLGMDVELIAPRPLDLGSVPHAFRDPKLDVWLVPKLTRLRLPNSFGVLPQTFRIVRRIRNHAVDFVYIRSGILSFVLVAALRAFTDARVVSEHNGWFPDEGRMLKHSRLLQAFEATTQVLDALFADSVRVVTRGLADKLIRYGVPQSKLFVVGNGTDTEAITPMKRDEALQRTGLTTKKRYLGFIGNLAPWQGVEILVDAFARLHASHPDLHLIIAGDGIERRRLERQIANLDIAAQVTFLGWRPMEDAGWIINCFDVATAPFVSERNSKIGLSPLKIRDYAAAGRAIVAADIAGISEFGRAGWLLVHRPDSIEDLASKLESLLEDDARRHELGRRARQFAEENFRWSKISEEIFAGISRT